MMLIKFRSIKFSKTFSKLRWGKTTNNNTNINKVSFQACNATTDAEISWELRPGGMLVQKRDIKQKNVENEVLVVRVTTCSQSYDVSIQPTSTFGELKMLLSFITSLDPKEQRVLFKGKERGDEEYLHMVGVRDKDKVLMLQDPATKERKQVINNMVASYGTISM